MKDKELWGGGKELLRRGEWKIYNEKEVGKRRSERELLKMRNCNIINWKRINDKEEMKET